MYPYLDPNKAESARKLERGATDARGPFGFGQFSGLLAGRQAGGVRLARQDGQALGRRYRSGPADARGPFKLGYVSGLLAGR